jgi:hypothetical protein
MKLTNRNRLPEAIVAAIQNDSYTKGDADISVTELLLPPQLRALKLKYYDELEEDVSDRIWSLLGQSVHAIIERATEGLAGVVAEMTLNSEYLGWKIKGQTDNIVLTDGELLDFKVTSTWKVRGESPPLEWVQQTNIYRRLAKKEKGIEISSIRVIAILRDWSKNESLRDQDYPQAQVKSFDIPVWSDSEADAFIEERIRLHQAAERNWPREPAPCSDYDIWAKPDKWAVIKKGNVRAVKLFEYADEASDLVASLGKQYLIKHRPGEATRARAGVRYLGSVLSGQTIPVTKRNNFRRIFLGTNLRSCFSAFSVLLFRGNT